MQWLFKSRAASQPRTCISWTHTQNDVATGLPSSFQGESRSNCAPAPLVQSPSPMLHLSRLSLQWNSCVRFAFCRVRTQLCTGNLKRTRRSSIWMLRTRWWRCGSGASVYRTRPGVLKAVSWMGSASRPQPSPKYDPAWSLSGKLLLQHATWCAPIWILELLQSMHAKFPLPPACHFARSQCKILPCNS